MITTNQITNNLNFKIMNEEVKVTEEMANNSVESNNVTMSNVEELKKTLKQEEKELKRLTDRKAKEAVIAAQQQVVDEAKTELTQAQELERSSDEKITVEFLTFSVVDEETGARTEQKKKIAFVKNNRPIDSKKVDSFMALIADKKYEKAYPIIVTSALKLIEADYTITDIKGKELTKEEAEDYLVILDGQHRGTAFAKLFATGKYTEAIPNVYVREVENVGEYLVDINNVGSSWSKPDKITVAALTTKEQLFKSVATLLKDGFNPTTAMLIYTGKSLSDKQVKRALKGEEIILPTGAKIDIERGDKFINLCKAAKMDVSFITKRYFIKGFNSYAKINSEVEAFEALDKLTMLNLTDKELKGVKEEDDFQIMLNKALEA